MHWVFTHTEIQVTSWMQPINAWYLEKDSLSNIKF